MSASTKTKNREKQPKSSTARLLVAGSGDAADLRYASGFMPVDPVVFVEDGRKRRYLVVPLLEYGRALDEARGATVWTPAMLDIPPEKRRDPAEWARFALQRIGIRDVRVPASFPLRVARELEKAGIRVEVAAGSIYPEREQKTQRELEYLATAQRAAVAAMRAAFRVLRAAEISRNRVLKWEGKTLTSERLKSVIHHVLLSRDCMARDIIVACGPHAADPHHRGEGPLRAGETIVLDIFPQHQPSGYWGDITRTVVKGRAPDSVRRMYRAVREAQAWAVSAIRPGARGDQIHSEIQRRFEAAGFPTRTGDGKPAGFIHGTGHGVGLEIHEAPSISNTPAKLKAGHVVTVEPGLYDPEIGGVRIEDTVAVTRNGAKILAACPYLFEIP